MHDRHHQHDREHSKKSARQLLGERGWSQEKGRGECEVRALPADRTESSGAPILTGRTELQTAGVYFQAAFSLLTVGVIESAPATEGTAGF